MDALIFFDGGSRPDFSYASYLIGFGRRWLRCWIFFGPCSANEAEYRALIASLEDFLNWLRLLGLNPLGFSVDIRGDSALVIHQLLGDWRACHPRMRDFRDRALQLLGSFGRYRLQWVPRSEIVGWLGH